MSPHKSLGSLIRGLMAGLALMAAFMMASPAQADIVKGPQERIEIDAGKGVLLRLPSAAANIFVADNKIADIQVKSPRLVYVIGNTSGETNLYALGNDDQVIYTAVLAVDHNTGRVNEAIQALMPGSDVELHSVEGALVLTGHVASAAQAEDLNLLATQLVGQAKVMNRVEVAGPNQVNLRVKFAEVSRSVVKQLGFNWEATFLNGGGNFFGIATGREIVENAATGVQEIARATGGAASIAGTLTPGNWDINGLIDALETNGLVSILAEPNLTAMSGKAASFLAGGEFPIPVPQQNNAVTIQYKKFGVGLTFTPTVLADNRINLVVNPEVSQLSSAGALASGGFSIPSLTTRRAETTVELGSGQSFAIAGLLQNDLSHDINKLPGLGDIPILGKLFQSDNYKRNESELVIVVTPYIVRPVNSPRMALPNDGFRSPTDFERLVKGELYPSQPLQDAPAPTGQDGRALAGPAGFILN